LEEDCLRYTKLASSNKSPFPTLERVARQKTFKR
jgi:hypothetical protein